MNQEISLSSQPVVPAAADYWTMGQAAVGTPPPANRQSPLKRIHRLLRGRYPMVITLGLLGAFGGAILGYSVVSPKFRSAGQVVISPIIPQPGQTDTWMPMYTQYMTTQLTTISSSRVVEKSLNDPEFVKAWQTAYPGRPLPDPEEFIPAIDPLWPRNTNMLEIGFIDKNKDVARAGARAVTQAYFTLYGDPSTMRDKKLEFLNKQKVEFTQQLEERREAYLSLVKMFGGDPAIMHNAVQEDLAKLELERTQAQVAYDAAVKASANNPTTAPSNIEGMVQAIARVDPQMRGLIAGREEAALRLDRLRMRYGDRHQVVSDAKAEIDFAQRRVADYAQQFLEQNSGRLPIPTDGSVPVDLNMMKAHLESLNILTENRKAAATKLAEQRARLEDVKAQIDRIQRDMATVEANIDRFMSEAELSELVKSVRIQSLGEDAQLASDKRKAVAAAGFVFGGAIPVGLMLMIGLLDSRFRYSDDASEDVLSGGVTLLGILPNLPDRLSDPQQAGIAAHCVHQIRTMLQINRTNDEPQVLAVTSAAPGDGKTSLTLALGLSYAACGARTLLIDCDLMAAGLSHRLNVSSPDGVLEAVANRALLEYVRTTDIADVAILPVGTTHAHHASTLSPVALRRLLSESKKQFDIILVDTGPILGSIEASLVCAAADRTILTVARGQQRPLVERSIGHLQAIGARLAGVVFNRAQAKDFERSLSGLALRSRSVNGRPSAATAPAHTAAAKAVAGSFKRAG